MTNEEIDLFNEGASRELEIEIEKLDKVELLRVEVDNTLAEAIREMDSLKSEYSKQESESLIDLCKQNVIDTIVGQFGIASVLLEAKDGGSVTTTHNFKKGITATEEDAAKYQDLQKVKEEGLSKERRAAYDKRKDQNRRNLKKSGVEEIEDAYTGKKIKLSDADSDHVVSAKENETNPGAHLHLNLEKRAQVATDDENLTYTKSSINRSKSDKPLDEFVDAENSERYDLDENRIKAIDKRARKHINKTVNKAAFKKYSKELLATGAKDAARIAAYQAIGVIIHDFALAAAEELKYILKNRGEKTLKDLFAHFKARMREVFKLIAGKWKEVMVGSFEAGITAFLSNILVFVINLFATTLKKLVSMIRAGFVSLCKAVKLMAHHPNMTQEEANLAAAKIMTAGVIGAISLGLSASIEKFLQAIPGLQPLMMFPIGGDKTVSDIIATTLSAVAGGVVTTIVIYFMDKMIASDKHDKLQLQLVTTSGVVLRCQVAKSYLALLDAYDFLQYETERMRGVIIDAGVEIAKSINATKKDLSDWGAILQSADVMLQKAKVL